MQKLTFFLELVTYSLPDFRRSFRLLFCQLPTLLLRFLLGVDESKLDDVEDVSAIDAAAATAADDDVVADPSAAEMSESRVSVRSVEETVVEGLQLGAKLESESTSIFLAPPAYHT